MLNFSKIMGRRQCDAAPGGAAPSSAGGSKRRWAQRRATPGGRSKQKLQCEWKTHNKKSKGLVPDPHLDQHCKAPPWRGRGATAVRALRSKAACRPAPRTCVRQFLGVHSKLLKEFHGIQLVSLYVTQAGAANQKGSAGVCWQPGQRLLGTDGEDRANRHKDVQHAAS